MNLVPTLSFNILHASHICPGVPCHSLGVHAAVQLLSPSKYRAVVHRISIFFKVIMTHYHHTQNVAMLEQLLNLTPT